MRGSASGFCVYNDPAIAISWLLGAGALPRPRPACPCQPPSLTPGERACHGHCRLTAAGFIACHAVLQSMGDGLQ